MAYTKQEFRTMVKRGEFYASKDGFEAELSMGETDRQLYIRAWFPADEHGKQGVPVSMQLKNWERLFNHADHIGSMTEKARASLANIRKLEAEQTAFKADMEKLNGSRSAFPDIFTDAVYAAKVAEIKAKYPNMHPKPKADAVKVGGVQEEGEENG